MSILESEVDAHSRYGMSQLLKEVLDVREGTVGLILQRLLQATRMHMGMDAAFISEFEGGRRTFRYVDKTEDSHLLQVGHSDPLEESYCQRVVDGRLPELIHNAQEVGEALTLPATRAFGIGAHLSVPIRLRDGSVFGTFCCFSFHAEHSLNERDRTLMHVFAEIAAELIEQDICRAREEKDRSKAIGDLLAHNKVGTVWQPVVDIASGRIIGVEALARFPNDDDKAPPDWFKEAASVGLADAMETRAVENGLKILKALKPHQYVACNASAQALLSGNLVEKLRQAPLERVVLEITEHDVIDDYAVLTEVLAPLRRQGLRLAIDDAGAGYASFRHILDLHPDIIKLDISLTHNINSDIARRSLALSLVAFAREIDCTLIAEGVEISGELATLAELGVDAAQGFFLHRPQSANALSRVLARPPF